MGQEIVTKLGYVGRDFGFHHTFLFQLTVFFYLCKLFSLRGQEIKMKFGYVGKDFDLHCAFLFQLTVFLSVQIVSTEKDDASQCCVSLPYLTHFFHTHCRPSTVLRCTH